MAKTIQNQHLHFTPNADLVPPDPMVDIYLLTTMVKLMKGKALRKHSLHEKTAASVLLKLFISGNE